MKIKKLFIIIAVALLCFYSVVGVTNAQGFNPMLCQKCNTKLMGDYCTECGTERLELEFLFFKTI